MMVLELRPLVMTVLRAGKARRDKAAKGGLCVACLEPLDDTRTVRGCHERCYRATLNAVAKGLTTIEERIRAGKLLERETAGRKPVNPVSVELSK